MYKVTKQFVSGILAGIMITEETSILFIVGRTYYPWFGSSYVVLSVEQI